MCTCMGFTRWPAAQENVPGTTIHILATTDSRMCVDLISAFSFAAVAESMRAPAGHWQQFCGVKYNLSARCGLWWRVACETPSPADAAAGCVKPVWGACDHESSRNRCSGVRGLPPALLPAWAAWK